MNEWDNETPEEHKARFEKALAEIVPITWFKEGLPEEEVLEKEYVEVEGDPAFTIVDSDTVDLFLNFQRFRMDRKQLDELLGYSWLPMELDLVAKAESEGAFGVDVEDF